MLADAVARLTNFPEAEDSEQECRKSFLYILLYSASFEDGVLTMPLIAASDPLPGASALIHGRVRTFDQLLTLGWGSRRLVRVDRLVLLLPVQIRPSLEIAELFQKYRFLKLKWAVMTKALGSSRKSALISENALLQLQSSSPFSA